MITGASSGVGRSLAIKLSERGYRLSLCGRQADKLQQTLQFLAPHTKVYSQHFCLSNFDQIASFYHSAINALSQVDVLINCAGLNSSRAPAGLPDWRALQQMLDINYLAPLKFIELSLPGMREAKQGVVLNVLSTTCLFANPGTAQYSASKAALDNHTKILRKELHQTGVKVLSLYPGGVNTDFRQADKPEYLSPEEVADAAISMLTMPSTSHIHELVIRPEMESNFS